MESLRSQESVARVQQVRRKRFEALRVGLFREIKHRLTKQSLDEGYRVKLRYKNGRPAEKD